MAAKARKDKKGYALRTGECQRKDGKDSWKAMKAKVAGEDTEKPMPQKVKGKEETL